MLFSASTGGMGEYFKVFRLIAYDHTILILVRVWFPVYPLTSWLYNLLQSLWYQCNRLFQNRLATEFVWQQRQNLDGYKTYFLLCPQRLIVVNNLQSYIQHVHLLNFVIFFSNCTMLVRICRLSETLVYVYLRQVRSTSLL